ARAARCRAPRAVAGSSLMGQKSSDRLCQGAGEVTGCRMMGNTIERARHRWREILPLLGIDTRFLVNKHGPCPPCGGRDRFRFDDKNGEGTYYCNQCGPGAGVILVRRKNDWDYKTACDEIDKILGDSKPVASTSRPKNNDRNLRAIERALATARQPD